jgi:hypothetical protein
MSKNSADISHWREFRQENFPKLFHSARPNSETPFYGLKEFDSFSEIEKRQLFIGFCQINAEVIIHLESLLILAFRRFRNLGENSTQTEAKMVFEEFHHSRAYRRYLWYEPEFGWPQKSLLLRKSSASRRALLFMAWIITHYPQSVFLIGAKLEAYSVAYAQSLYRSFGSWDANSWTQINYHHLLDEAQHVRLQFQMHDEYFSQLNWFKKGVSVILAAVFFLFMQWVMLYSSYSLLQRTFPHLGLAKTTHLTLRMGQWITRHYQPYIETRNQLTKLFAAKRPWAGPLFRFIYW